VKKFEKFSRMHVYRCVGCAGCAVLVEWGGVGLELGGYWDVGCAVLEPWVQVKRSCEFSGWST